MVFALPGELGLHAQTLGGVPIVDPSTAIRNVLPVDRWLAAGHTMGVESGIREGEYAMGYVQATIPLKSETAVAQSPEGGTNTEGLSSDQQNRIRLRFLDLGVRIGALETGYGTGLLDVRLGSSGLRALNQGGFFFWAFQARFAESTKVFSADYTIPRVGIRAQSTLGYARLVKPGMVWYAGAVLAYDDGMWIPLPWGGMQAQSSKGHRWRVLLPREIQYRYRWGQKSPLLDGRWEVGAQAQMRMDRFGQEYPLFAFYNPVGTRRLNATLWEGRVGAWVAHRIVGGRLWVQLHGGWVPYRRGVASAAPRSESIVDPFSPTEAPAIPTEWAWDVFKLDRFGHGLKARPYFELRFVADLGNDWLGLDLGRLL